MYCSFKQLNIIFVTILFKITKHVKTLQKTIQLHLFTSFVIFVKKN